MGDANEAADDDHGSLANTSWKGMEVSLPGTIVRTGFTDGITNRSFRALLELDEQQARSHSLRFRNRSRTELLVKESEFEL